MNEHMKSIGRWRFYALSFTWGLPMSLVGLIVCLALICTGHKPERYGHCYYMTVGKKNWGGVNFGWFFLVSPKASEKTKRHELGHGYQNACEYGWLMPIFGLISFTRYCLVNFFNVKLDYYAWQFESQANEIGDLIMGEGWNEN